MLINPVITESDGEWAYDEGCLSIPGMSFEIVRPKQILVTGRDLDGNEIEFEADELWSRLIQHELDHLDGILMLERLDDDQRKAALKELTERNFANEAQQAQAEADFGVIARGTGSAPGASSSGLQLP